MTGPSNAPRCHRVEISGWDENEDFFVERADLKWQEENRKHVALRKPVRAGSLVFVRLLDLADENPAFPVAYRAESIEAGETKDYEISLVRLWPKGQREAGLH